MKDTLPPTHMAPVEGTWRINLLSKGPSVRSHVSGREGSLFGIVIGEPKESTQIVGRGGVAFLLRNTEMHRSERQNQHTQGR